VTPVNVPWTDVNSEAAIVVAWHVGDRTEVRAGTPLVDVETSKAALEIEAPEDGVVLQLVAAGSEVQVGQPVAHVFPDVAALEAFDRDRAARPAATSDASGPAATEKARTRAAELGIDLADIPAAGLITVKDVEAAAQAIGSSPAAPPDRSALPDPLPGDGTAQRLLIIGAGLGATQVVDILAEVPGLAAVAIVDDNPAFWRREVAGLPVVGGSERIGELWEARAYDAAVIAISTSVEARARLRRLCRAAGVRLANVIDARAKVATDVRMGEGNVLCAFVQLGTGTRIGDNNFLSAFNSFDHHNVLGSDISTGPGCMTSGEVKIEDRARLGTGIYVEPKLTIGEGAVVASGAVIVRSVPAHHAVKTKVVTTTVVPIRER
jgi:sugar O-acyltransferase (sialic acid O-acetyltransferase NeuD family)